MRQLHIRREWGIALGLGLLFAAAASYGQSLGDVARQQRQKQQSKSAQAPRKVITNEDIPESPASSRASASASAGSDKLDQPSATPSSGDVMRAGEQFKAQIRAQKNSIASQSTLWRPIATGTASSTTSSRYKSRKKRSACSNNWMKPRTNWSKCRKRRVEPGLATRFTTRSKSSHDRLILSVRESYL